MLASFLRRTVLADFRLQQHIVFLGDTFELADLTEAESLARLESILASHPDTLHALQACSADGAELHFVCGNHDVELARPSVAARLSELLSAADPTLVQVHPWLLYVPNVLLAEHGHLHHALHRIPEVLRTAINGTDELELPPLAALHAHPTSSRLSRAGAVARACLASERAERRARMPAYNELLQTESRRLTLDGTAVRELARLSRFRTVSALPRAATRLVLASTGRNVNGGQPPAAAGKVAGILETHRSPVAWYISAHTHRALEASLEASQTRYINTGTWSSDVRGQGPDQGDRQAFPYAIIEVDDAGAINGGLRYWHPLVG
jgi:hypothetical protein